MPASLDAIIAYLQVGAPFSPVNVDTFGSSHGPVAQGMLEGIVRGLAMSHPELGAPQASEYAGRPLWNVPMTSALGVRSVLHVLEEPGDGIAGLRFTLDYSEPPESTHDLQRALALLGSAAVVHTGDDDDTQGYTVGPERIAVSSLIKIAVVATILAEVDAGRLSLSEKRTLSGDDLSFLSAGLGEPDIGSAITVRDLCIRALAVSDNTASDVLLSLVGSALVLERLAEHGVATSWNSPLRSMRESVLESWGDADGGTRTEVERRIRRRSVTEIAHTRGLDFYIPLDVIAAMQRDVIDSPVASAAAVGDPYPGYLFKGGSAPGVFAGSWVNRSDPRRSIAFAMNSTQPFGALEEAFALDVVLRFAAAGHDLRPMGHR